jgi:glycosyltransferase involved in cell wall biosynthesis
MALRECESMKRGPDGAQPRTAQAARPRVSVIVAAHDAESTIDRLLAPLDRQTLSSSAYEVLVSDDGSHDGTQAMVRRSRSARLIEAARPGRRVGAYAARNLALEQACGSVLAITDADCRPARDWLQAGLDELERLEADLLGARIEVPIGREPRVVELVDAARHLDQERLVAMGFAAFANFFCRRSVIDRLGGFNGRLISNGDREFCMRATASGFRLAYSARPVVTHLPRRRARDVAARCFRMGYGRAQTRSFAAGPARSWRRNWLPAREYLPSLGSGRAAYGRRRLEECGYEPSVAELRRMELAGLWLVGAPVAAGYVSGLADAVLRPGARQTR